MSFRVVRQSKFRHVFGKELKKEQGFDGVRITRNAWDSNFCSINPKFIAITLEAQGGGAFIVLNIADAGRVDLNAPKCNGHKAAVLDIQFNPFNDNLIASAAEDCLVMVWNIPDGGLTEDMTNPVVTLEGHQRRVGIVEWHPTADNVLLSAGFDYMIFIWDVATGAKMNEISCHSDTIYCCAWNFDGSLLATTCKDKKLRVLDPRKGTVLTEGLAHDGSKAARVVFVGESNKLFSVGFSKTSERQYSVWDSANLDECLRTESIDTSSGVLFPFYDPDTRMIYVAGKGDGNIRYFEVDDERPYVHFLSQFQSQLPQRGTCWMPKRGLNIAGCEVALCYKLHPKGFVEGISFTVPRKSTLFQEDIFPPTNVMEPTMSAAEWLAGGNIAPKKMSLKGGYVEPTRQAQFVAPVAVAKAVNPEDLVPVGEKELVKAWHANREEIKLLKAKLASAEIKLRGLNA